MAGLINPQHMKGCA